ncbi:MAG: hypothetical protein K8S97_16830, partial [Anaerolineae bacterium]|nr:hypothetical protein [Anaerolineae bacterium]
MGRKNLSTLFCLFISLLMITFVTPSVAQEDDTQLASPRSGRYTLAIPETWQMSTKPLLSETQAIFPSESLVIADTQATADSLFSQSQVSINDFLGSQLALEGAIILGHATPGFVEITDNDTTSGIESATEIATGIANEFDPEPTITTHQYQDHSATITAFRLTDNVEGRLLTLIDRQGNLLLLIAVSDRVHLAEVDTALQTLQYREFAVDELLNPSALEAHIELITESLTVEIPRGWWVLDTLTYTVFSPAIHGFDPLAYQLETELIIMVYRVDDTALDAVLDMRMPEREIAALSVVTGDWQAPTGVEGVEWEFAFQSTVAAQGEEQLPSWGKLVLIEDRSHAIALVAVGNPEHQLAYTETVDAILDTVARIFFQIDVIVDGGHLSYQALPHVPVGYFLDEVGVALNPLD